MTSTLPARRGGLVPRASWAGAVALTLGFLFGSSGALAAAPPANTVIGNQASASYLDPDGASQLATSNLVQTTVQQVGSFTLDGNSADQLTTPVNTKTGAAGATVYAPHVLTNTGNGEDTFTISVINPGAFSKVQIFADANADGLPDNTTALCTAVPAGSSPACPYTTPSVAGGNGTFPFVVAYSIPGTATGTGSFGEATIKAVPTKVSLYDNGAVSGVDNRSVADKDQVNLTTEAAFSATKSLSVPAVKWVNGGAWPAASTSGQRSAASCPATVADASAPAPGCTYTTYTLRFSNTGGAAGKFVLTDPLPSGFTYITGSAVWSSAPGTALTEASGSESPAAAGIDFAFSGNTLTFVVDSLPVNATQTVSFVVRVDNDAAIGTSTTDNDAQYNPEHAPTATSTLPGTTGSSTNIAAFNVLGAYGVVLGSDIGSATASVDDGVDDPKDTDVDTTTKPGAVPGSTIKFTQKAFNTGNVPDTVNLAKLGGDSFPAGTTFKLLAADGATPLIDTNGDGIVDTGPIAAGNSATFVLAATLPATAPATAPGVSFNAIVKGTSAGDSTKFDSTRDTLMGIVSALVDLTNTNGGNGIAGNTGNGDVGPGPSPDPTTTNTTAAGTTTVFDLWLKNNDSMSTVYKLDASQTNSFPGTLPTGWTVKFVLAGDACSANEFNSHSLNSNEVRHLKACVTPPASQVPTTQRIYFQVRSTTPTSSGAVAIDTKTDAVTVTAANPYSATLTPNNNGQVAPGGSVVYAHTLTNTGAQSCAGPYSITATLPEAGWTTALYIDENGDGQLDASDTLVTGTQAGPLLAGGTKKLLLKVFAPGGATAGSAATATVTVTFPAGTTSCGTPSATDLTTVIAGQMRLVKTQAKIDCDTEPPATTVTVATPLTAKPGECLMYRVVATNEGASPVTNLLINDAVPAYTSLTGAFQPATQCTSSGVTPAFTNANFGTPSSSLVNCGTATNTVNPGGTATMTFSVKINN